ncbi:MAG: hypothetical protein M5U19_18385 [Microthrixaceae bacterium]|nr:hypothetical protein [Microthrixaceae bacterium]
MADASVRPRTGLRRLAPVDAGTRLHEVMSRPYEYREWEDVYREQWTWDDVVHVSHLRTNCISTCSLDAFVKDGIVWREEQNATFPQQFEGCPTSTHAGARRVARTACRCTTPRASATR